MARTSQTGFVDTYLAALLAQASHRISSEFHRVVRAQGLSVSEWRVLASLAEGHPVSTSRLAELAIMKTPTTSRLLDRMQARGQITRMVDERDRRVTLVRITPKGQRTVSRLIERAREHEAKVLAPFGLERADALKTSLRTLIDMPE
jgi:DNA-binding MarR family transcriptional regulator